jgi:ATPase subunit of ABC transporter with duplicated ATPase domains
MSAPAQLRADRLGFSYGPRTVLDEVELTLAPGDRIGVIGANGTGKSTLLRILAGDLSPERGSVTPTPPSATVGLLHQDLDDEAGDTIVGFLARCTGVGDVLAEFDRAIAELSESRPGADERYDRALTRYVDVDAAGFDERVAATLTEVGLAGVAPDRPTRSLSGGQRARVGLAAVMLAAFDVLLLDEPTNDLDLEGLDLLERFVLDADRPMAIVSHDREFLATVATAIVEIDDHTHTATRFNGGYDAWLAERERAEHRHQQAYDEYQAKRAELGDRARRERQWSARGVRRARADRSEKDRSIRAHRVETSENLAGKAKRTERALERLERQEAVEAPW